MIQEPDGQSKLFLKPKPTLTDLQQYVRETLRERGFSESNISGRFQLLIEEVGEFAKASRKIAGMKLSKDSAVTNIAHEAADVFIAFLGLCNLLGIDLEQAFRDKEDINKQRTWK